MGESPLTPSGDVIEIEIRGILACHSVGGAGE